MLTLELSDESKVFINDLPNCNLTVDSLSLSTHIHNVYIHGTEIRVSRSNWNPYGWFFFALESKVAVISSHFVNMVFAYSAQTWSSEPQGSVGVVYHHAISS